MLIENIKGIGFYIKLFKTICFSIVLVIFFVQSIFACTMIIVGKDVSDDGSAYFCRTSDAGENDVVSLIAIKGSNEDGEYEYFDESNGFRVMFPKKHYQYTCILYVRNFIQGIMVNLVKMKWEYL